MGIPVIDSHVHLYDEDGLNRLAWMTPDNKLCSPHGLPQFIRATEDATGEMDVKGLVFVEADVKSGLSEKEWKHSIDEYTFVAKYERDEESKEFIKAIIPWAPLPGGRHSLEAYTKLMAQSSQEGLKLVKGFRYLVQDKPQGTLVSPGFIDGLRWLSENNFVFDLGIDMHSGGIWQLQELTEMDKEVSGLKIVVNHLTKPDLTQASTSTSLEECFSLWKSIEANTKNTYYVKLSGCFSEMPASVVSGAVPEIAARIKPWLRLFMEVFGHEHIIWGSDWPVCKLKMSSDEDAWPKWVEVSQVLIHDLGLSDDIYYSNVKRAYNI